MWILAGAHLLRPTEGDDSEWRKFRISALERSLSAGVDRLEFVERGLAAQLRDELQQLQAGQCGRMFRWAEAVVGEVPERARRDTGVLAASNSTSGVGSQRYGRRVNGGKKGNKAKGSVG